MKGLYIIVGMAMGLFAGGAVAVLAMTHTSFSDESGLGVFFPLLILMGGFGVIAGGILASRLYGWFASEKASRICWQAKLGIAAASLCGAPLLVVWAFHSSLNRNYPPSDASMIAHFYQEKPALEKTVAEYSQIKYSGTKTQGLIFDRWGSEPLAGPDSDVQTRMGYAYFVKPPKELRPSLVGLNYGDAPSIKAYRHIEGNWYLFYDHRPD